MPTTNSYEYGLSIASPPTRLPAYLRGGRLRTLRATYTFASQASGAIINLGIIPKGARVIGCFANMSATHGGSATVKIGDSADDAKFRLAAPLTAAAYIPPQVASVGATDGAAVVGADAPYTSDTLVFLTIGAAALPSSGRAYIDIVYVLD